VRLLTPHDPSNWGGLAARRLRVWLQFGHSHDGAAPDGPKPFAPEDESSRLISLETAPGSLLPSCSQRLGKGTRLRGHTPQSLR